MAVCIKAPKNSLLLDLMVKKEARGTISYLRAFEEFENDVFAIPLAFGAAHKIKPANSAAPRKSIKLEGTFISKEQEIAYRTTLENLAARRTCILSVHVGFGKTFIALALMAHIGLKSLIVVPTSKKILQAQWLEEINRFVPTARVQLLETKTRVNEDCDIFIVGSQTIRKIHNKLNFIKFVVVDELHLVLSSEGYKNLLYLFPQYLLGLSATPYRLDGSNQLVELFFGAQQVSKQLQRQYVVNVIHTKFTYKIEKTEQGKVNWGAILNQQAENEERNSMIANIICAHKLKFLVLCKRVAQIKDLSQKCRERGLSVQIVYEDIQPQKDERTLIGSIQKLGVGFSDSTFEALIIASDVEDYFIQYFGRVLRRPQAKPIVFDIVDNCGLLKKHYKSREQVYEESGGEIDYSFSLENLTKRGRDDGQNHSASSIPS